HIRLGNEIAIPGETPSAEVFPLVSERAHALVVEQYRLLNKEIFPGLAEEGVRFLAEPQWTREQRSWLHNYFLREMIPLLTPIGLDPSHTFPRVLNKSLNYAVQLEVADNMPAELEQFLLEQFQLVADDLYRVDGPVNLVRLMQVPDLVDKPALKFAAFVPGVPKQLETSPDLFRVIRKGDVLLHHPFQSFNPVIDFLEQSVDDPSVVAIKQTVYRTGTDSVLMKYLIDAAQRGKEVTVFVELLARFDEEANLNWAAKLEEVGAHVVYGVVGYKTHAKMSLVVRREDGRLRRYAHVSTGNYHPRTARLYTDFGLLTADEKICEDVNEVFKQLTGLGRARRLHHLWISPFSLD